MEPAPFSPRWKQPVICRCHTLHRSIHDLRNDVSNMHFSIIYLSIFMYALEKSSTHFPSSHTWRSCSSWLDQYYLNLVSSAHNEVPHCAIFSTTQSIPPLLPKYPNQLPILERPQPVNFWYSSSIGTTTLSWVSACSTIVEHSQQEGFTECLCQRHV
jgi:hypothetical protein